MSAEALPRRLLVVSPEQLPQQLKALNPDWSVLTAPNGAEGLQAFASQPLGAVVADLQLPDMSGSEFLQEIMARFPSTIRFLQFKEDQRAEALENLGWAHQFLAKPLDPAYLNSTLASMEAMGNRVQDRHVRELVTRIGQLPAVPELYREITALLETEYATTEELAKLIAKDTAMTAMILKLANSAFFGLRHPVADAAQAASYLGADLLKALALGHSLFGQVGLFQIPGFTIDQLLNHSLAVAGGAKRIAEAEGLSGQKSVECFTAGILHDAGLLILASRFPEEYVKVIHLIRKAGGDLQSAEFHTFGATHGDLGAYLMALWGLPESIPQACCGHHQPGRFPGKALTPTLAVHVADALHSAHAEHELFATSHLDLPYLRSLGLQDRVPAWREAMGLPQA